MVAGSSPRDFFTRVAEICKIMEGALGPLATDIAPGYDSRLVV
jgi:thiamine biosynthesis protein ThiC